MSIQITHRQLGRYLQLLEIIGFIVVLALLWLDELFDLPHRVFGTVQTPFNPGESLVESVLVAVLGVAVVLMTRRLLGGIRHLEGHHVLCTSCLRVQDNGGWELLADWLQAGSEADFTPGTCPDCKKDYDLHLENY